MQSFLRSCSLTLLALPLLASCGKDSDSKKSGPTEPPRAKTIVSNLNLASSANDARILGEWTTGCVLENQGKNSVILDMAMAEKYQTILMKVFQDTNCREAAFDARITSTYRAVINEAETETQVYTALLHSQVYANAASSTASCGFSEWQTGVEYDVTNLFCPIGKGGLSFPGNRTQNLQTQFYVLYADAGKTVLDWNGQKFTRPLKAGDESLTIPPAPVPEFIFADKASIENERTLRSRCQVSPSVGVRNCIGLTTAEEAGYTYTLLQRFSASVLNDSRFRERKDIRDAMMKGYNNEWNRIFSFPPYLKAATDLYVGIEQFNKSHKGLELSRFHDVNAVDGLRGFQSLLVAFEGASFASEIARLGITHIIIRTASSYEKDLSGRRILYWSFSDSAQDQIARLAQQKVLE